MVAFNTANAATLAPLMNLTSAADASAIIAAVRNLPLGAVVELDAGDHGPAVARSAARRRLPGLSARQQGPAVDRLGRRQRRHDARHRRAHSASRSGRSSRSTCCRSCGRCATASRSAPSTTSSTARRKSPTSRCGIGDAGDRRCADHRRRGTRRHLLPGVRRDAGRHGAIALACDANLTRPRRRSVLTVLLDPGELIHAQLGVPALTKCRPRRSRRTATSSSTATAVEKTVARPGPTRRSARSSSSAGPYSVMLGSGFLPYATQQQANRGGAVAGTTFYIARRQDRRRPTRASQHRQRRRGRDGRQLRLEPRSDRPRLQARSRTRCRPDPVATGPSDSALHHQGVHRRPRRQRLALRHRPRRQHDVRRSSTPDTSCYAGGRDQPIFSSMATVTVGSASSTCSSAPAATCCRRPA